MAIAAIESRDVVQPEQIASPEDDLTGRDRFARNVITSFIGHLVFIVAGFIMPHQIDQKIGQVGLGIWDFGWTAVNYFFLAQIGVGVSVNRYVARYRAARDNEGLNRIISSVIGLQFVAACVVLGLTAVSALWLPNLFAARLYDQTATARSVIALLGLSVAIRTSVQAFSGVVTGCHRWDLHNLLNGTSYAITVLAMLVVLSNGMGLVAIAVVYVMGTVLNEAARIALAFYVCPELRVSPGRARWSEARSLLAFGAKLTSIDAVGIIVAQLTNMLVLGQIGIGTLALYSRLAALIRQTESIALKFSLPLTPTASSLQGTGRDSEVRELIVSSTRSAAYLVWPILIGLAIAGDDILHVWMGPQYSAGYVLMLMALGSLVPISQQPIYTILVGLNFHGQLAAIRIIGSFAGFIASLVAMRTFNLDLLGLAVVGLIVSNVVSLWTAIDTCRQLSIPLREYFKLAYAGPIACALPFALSLIVVDVLLSAYPIIMLVTCCVVGAAVLLPLYWRVAPPSLRAQVVSVLTSAVGQLRLRQMEG
jgi:O-antigen/teichoic acid export membrane protein